MKGCNFIKTKDPGTKDALVSEGFELIDETGGVYTFLNDPGKEFSKKGRLKMEYSDMLCI